MKKLLILQLIVMACVFIASCTAEFEEEQIMGREERAAELKAEIMKMAEDYGISLNVEVTPAFLNKNGNTLKKIEAVFAAMAQARGRYELNSSSEGDRVMISQNPLRTSRNRSYQMSEGVPSSNAIHCSCNFADPVSGSTIKVISHLLGTTVLRFECSCQATWLLDTLSVNFPITNAEIIPSVNLIYEYISDENLFQAVEQGEPTIHYEPRGRTLGFNGHLDYKITVEEGVRIDVRFHFAGGCNENGGSITWYTDPI